MKLINGLVDVVEPEIWNPGTKYAMPFKQGDGYAYAENKFINYTY